MEQKRYVPEENQGIDQFRESEQVLFNNLKVASLGKVIGINEKGYNVELIPKINGDKNIIQTINFIYEKQHLVHEDYKNKSTEKEMYIVKSYKRVKIAENAIGRFILVLFLDNYVSQIGNENLNIDGSKTKHSLTNGYALEFIDMWPEKEEKEKSNKL